MRLPTALKRLETDLMRLPTALKHLETACHGYIGPGDFGPGGPKYPDNLVRPDRFIYRYFGPPGPIYLMS